MIRICIRLDKHDYELAKEEAKAQGISFGELARRSIGQSLSYRETAPWMMFAGVVDSGDPDSSQPVDDTVYGLKS